MSNASTQQKQSTDEKGLTALIDQYRKICDEIDEDATDEEMEAFAELTTQFERAILRFRPSSQREAQDKVKWVKEFADDFVIEGEDLAALIDGMLWSDEPKDVALIELGKDMERHNDDVHRLQWETSEQGERDYETAMGKLIEALGEVEKQTATALEGVKVKAMAIKYANGSESFKDAFGTSSTDMRLAGAVIGELLALQ